MVRQLSRLWVEVRKPSPEYVTSNNAQGGANENTTDTGISLSPVRSMPALSPLRQRKRSLPRKSQRGGGQPVSQLTTSVRRVAAIPPELTARLTRGIHRIIEDRFNDMDVEDDAQDDQRLWSVGKLLATRQTVDLHCMQEALANIGISVSLQDLACFLRKSQIAHKVPWGNRGKTRKSKNK